MKTNKTLILALMSAFGLTYLCSCEDELVGSASSAGSIKVEVSTDEMETRSGGTGGTGGMELKQTMVMNEDSLLLMEYVCDNRSLPFDEVVNSTRSATVDMDSLKASVFGVQAFLDNYGNINVTPGPTLYNTDQYILNGRVAYDDSEGWGFTNAAGTAPVEYKWLNDIYFTFWSYYPKDVLEESNFGTVGSRHKMTIGGYAVASSSDDQRDLLVAYNNRYSDKNNENVSLSIGFKHILSEIYFDFSDITDDGYSVDKIEIIDAYSEGDCEITGVAATKTTPVEVPTSIVWTPNTSKKKTFTMSLSTTDAKNNFFLIPQDLSSSGAKLKITMTKDGKTRTDEKELKNITWLPGKYYKYVLTYTPATYKFSLNTPSQATTTFTDKNTSGSSTPKYIKGRFY